MPPGINLSGAFRSPGGTEAISAVDVENLYTSITTPNGTTPTSFKVGIGPIASIPVQLIRIGSGITVGSVGRSYPYDGDAILDGITNSVFPPVLTLDVSGVPGTGIDYSGCDIIPMDGPGVGIPRRIVGHITAARAIYVNEAWPVGQVPVAGNKYRIAIPVVLHPDCIFTAEYNNSTEANKATVVPQFYDFPRTSTALPGATPSPRAPLCYVDGPIDIENLGIGGAVGGMDVETTGYFKGRARRVSAHGATHYKLHLQALPGGTMTLYGGRA